MTQLPTNIRQQLLNFVCGTLRPVDFESWLYASSEVKAALSSEEYLSLISPNYREAGGLSAVRSIAEAIVEARYASLSPKYRVELLVGSMLKGEMDFLTGLRELVSLHHSGYDFIPILFVGFESETDAIPDQAHYYHWEPASLAKQLEELDRYRPHIVVELQRLFEALQAERRSA